MHQGNEIMFNEDQMMFLNVVPFFPDRVDYMVREAECRAIFNSWEGIRIFWKSSLFGKLPCGGL